MSQGQTSYAGPTAGCRAKPTEHHQNHRRAKACEPTNLGTRQEQAKRQKVAHLDLGFTDIFGAPGAVQQALLAIPEIQAASELSQSCTELRPVFKAKLGSVSKLRLNFVMRLDVVRQQLDLLKQRALMLQQVTEVNTFCPTDMVVALLVDLLRLHYPRLTKLVLRLGHWQLPDGLCFWLPPTLQELTLAAETDEDDGQLDVVFGDWSSNWKRLIVEGADAGSTNIHLPISDVMLDKLYLVCTCPTFSGWSQARNNQANFFVKDLLAVDLCQPVLECIKGVVTAWVQFTSVSFAQIVEAWPGIEELQAMGDYEDMRLAASDSFPAAWFDVSAAVSLRKLTISGTSAAQWAVPTSCQIVDLQPVPIVIDSESSDSDAM